MLGRMRALTDGVFAVVLTLLVLGLAIPETHGNSDAELARQLVPIAWKFGAYVLSFALVGIFWLVHVSTDRAIRTADRATLAANLASLLPVTVLPFTTEVSARFPGKLAWSLYAINVGVCALASIYLWRVVMKRNHADPTGIAGFRLIPHRSGMLAAIFFLSAAIEWKAQYLGRMLMGPLIPIGFALVKQFVPDPEATAPALTVGDDRAELEEPRPEGPQG